MNANVFRLGIAILGCSLACDLAAAGTVVRVRFAAGQDEFDLAAAAGGVQVLTFAVAGAELEWVDPSVAQRLSRGRLALAIPVAAGESVVPKRPVAASDGGTVFEFAKAGVEYVAPGPPPAVPPPAAPSSMPATNFTPAAPAVVTPPPADAVQGSGAGPAGTGMAGVSNAPTEDVAAAIARLLPGPLAFDPLAQADFAIPESPGAAVLDQTTQILRPVSPREAVTSLLSNFDQTGKLLSGFSIAVTPYTVLRKEPVRLADYNRSSAVRFLTRLQVSLAAKTGATTVAKGPSPALFGIGVSGVFFDDSDPRCDPALLGRLGRLFPTSWETSPEALAALARGEAFVVPPVEKRKLDAFDEITAAARRAKWNASAMGFGYAMRLRSPSGEVSDARNDGGAVWFNYGRPGFGSLEANSQFLFTASYRYHDAFTRGGLAGVEDSFSFAAQFRAGIRDFNGFVQATHHWRTPRGQPRTSDTPVEIGIERKLADGLWLNLSWTNNDSLGGESAIKTGLRYGFGQAASLGEVK